MYNMDNAIYVVGIAKPGGDDSIYALYQNLSLGLVIDRTTGEILDLGVSMVLDETVYFVQRLLIGKSLTKDSGEIVELLRTRFFALSQKAVIAAFYDAKNHYTLAMKTLGYSQNT